MKAKSISTDADIAAAAGLSAESHRRLRKQQAFLPARNTRDFETRIKWVTQKGAVMGLYEGADLAAFMGAFPLQNFRSAGPGTVGPDWCNAAATRVDAAICYPELYRQLAPRLIAMGCRIHAFSIYASETDGLRAMELTGFGHIVLDAASPTEELRRSLTPGARDVEVRRAEPGEAPELAGMNEALADHIRSAPVLMPGALGAGAS